MTRGYDRPLYVLPFDHRGSFQSGLFGWKGALSDEQTAQIADAKRIVYDGFRAALADGVSKSNAAILVDEQFGAAILRDATADGVTTCCPAERSGQKEFEFEYGDDFVRHIEAMRPTFCKVLVRYNPEGDPTLNEREAGRLKRLSDYLAKAGHSRFMFELLVPPEQSELDRVGGEKATYDRQLRPALMVRAIQALQVAGVEPDVWKIEGLDRREDCEAIVATARAGGRSRVGCIILGRGENETHVRAWLSTAAGVPGFIGFAVGRTVFWDPLAAWRAGTATRAAAVAAIEQRYRAFVDLFESARDAAAGRDGGA